jgi:hypothetical protein
LRVLPPRQGLRSVARVAMSRQLLLQSLQNPEIVLEAAPGVVHMYGADDLCGFFHFVYPVFILQTDELLHGNRVAILEHDSRVFPYFRARSVFSLPYFASSFNHETASATGSYSGRGIYTFGRRGSSPSRGGSKYSTSTRFFRRSSMVPLLTKLSSNPCRCAMVRTARDHLGLVPEVEE